MAILKKTILWASENNWLKKNLPEFAFIRRAVKRFMPGEKFEDALKAASALMKNGIPSVFTYLGENIDNLADADKITEHYLNVLEHINRNQLSIEISVKLTQLGFDLQPNKTYENFVRLAEKAAETGRTVWIDMESSKYKKRTIDFYLRALKDKLDAGLCLQAYLIDSLKDLETILNYSSKIRLVKGAYKESENIAFAEKRMVDENYYRLAQLILDKVKSGETRGIFATHDEKLINKIQNYSLELGIPSNNVEFQMLYGIQSELQKQLVKQGYDMKVLISYGDAWFPWYMRRLAERPANIMFVLKNIFKV